MKRLSGQTALHGNMSAFNEILQSKIQTCARLVFKPPDNDRLHSDSQKVKHPIRKRVGIDPAANISGYTSGTGVLLAGIRQGSGRRGIIQWQNLSLTFVWLIA
jgi:hypothetical protein